MAKPPAFPFYPKDWLTDRRVRAMTLAQRGLYLTAMCHYWVEAELPSDRESLLRLFNLPPDEFDRDWPVVRRHFRRDRRILYQPRLREQLLKSEAFRAKQSAAGTASARSRAGFTKAKVDPPPEGEEEGKPVAVVPLRAHLAPTYRPLSAGFSPGPRRVRARRVRKNIEQFRKKSNGGSTVVEHPFNLSIAIASTDQEQTPPSPPERGGVGGGESQEGKPMTDARDPVVDGADLWELWRRIAGEHGCEIRLGISPTQMMTCASLARAYTAAELEQAMTAWWNSRYTGGRNLGMFAAQLPEVLLHLKAGAGEFRAPGKGPMLATAPSRQADAAPRDPQGSGLDWLCPHDPHCGSKGGCRRLQDIAALKEDLRRTS
jgi:uncharacterized protein YdaU (DUF1376 family)